MGDDLDRRLEPAVLASVPSATLLGVYGRPVRVEVHVGPGMPGFTVVGLPETTCRETRDRVRAALLSSRMRWPTRPVTVSLTPPGSRRGGAGLDLAIAMALLVADEQLEPEAVGDRAFVGELGLDGSIRAVPGALALVDALDTDEIVVGPGCVVEAQLVGRHTIRAASHLGELLAAMRGLEPWPDLPPPPDTEQTSIEPALADVRGQRMARSALQVAAAGGHHLLLVGPPGAGRAMLARSLPGLLPDLPRAHAMEVTRIHSAAGLPLPPNGLVTRPPLRQPHHGTSAVSLLGGGSGSMQPGEVSCAHRGVLFMDDLGDFPSVVLDNMRQPLEEGVIRMSRAAAKATFPARLLLVGTMNPCPCGEGAGHGSCRCSPQAALRYARKVSGPLLDRFDLRVEVGCPDVGDLLLPPAGESTAAVAARVAAARDRASHRGVETNAELAGLRLYEVAPFDDDATQLVEHALCIGRLTGRGLEAIRRVALTIADLVDEDPPLTRVHMSAAMSLRATPSFVSGRIARRGVVPGVDPC